MAVRSALIFLLLVFPAGLLMAGTPVMFRSLEFSDDEKVALRREMVEYDVQMRNLASVIAMGYPETLAKTLQSLQTFQTLQSPYYQTGFEGALLKLRNYQLEQYLKDIQKSASRLAEYLDNQNKKGREIDWGKIADGYSSMLHNCRHCHERTIKIK